MIFTSIPLGLYISAKHGIFYGTTSYLLYCGTGIFFKLLQDREKRGLKTNLYGSIFSSFLWITAIYVILLIFFISGLRK